MNVNVCKPIFETPPIDYSINKINPILYLQPNDILDISENWWPLQQIPSVEQDLTGIWMSNYGRLYSVQYQSLINGYTEYNNLIIVYPVSNLYSQYTFIPRNVIIMPGEIWEPVYGTTYSIMPGYFISNYGRFYSVYTNNGTGGLLTGRVTDEGYINVRLKRLETDQNGNFVISYAHSYALHRLLMLTFEFNPDYSEMEVNHEDGDKSNNTYPNLSWCTPQENVIHAWEHGLNKALRGEDNGNAKYSNDQIYEVVMRIKAGESYKTIAKDTGVSYSTVCGIARGHSRRDITNEIGLNDYRRTACMYTDENIREICAYFRDNSYKYNKRSELFKALVYDLNHIFTEGYNENIRHILNHILVRNTYVRISHDYVWSIPS